MGLLQKMGISHQEMPMTAEKCCYETKHGLGSFKPVEDRISDKQDDIRGVITMKMGNAIGGVQENGSYMCVVDIDEDLQDKESIEKIFEPFIEEGFEILNLSEEIKGIIPTSGLYLISWERAFKKVEKVVKL